MIFQRFHRLLPAIVVALGLTLTVQLASGLSSELAERNAASLRSDVTQFSAAADTRAEVVRRESERIEALLQTVLELEGTDVTLDDLVTDVDAFGRDGVVRAVALSDYQSTELVLPDGELGTETVPGSVQGLTPTNEGRWVGTVTYRLFSESESGRSAAAVVDINAILASPPLADGYEIQIVDFPGQADAQPLNPSLDRLGQNVYRTPADALETRRNVELFGEEAQLILSSPDGATAAAQSSSRELSLMVLAGGLATLVAAFGAWLVVRRIDRFHNERDVVASARQAAISRFSASFAHAPMGVVEVDERGEILMVNPRFASKLGYLPEEMAGMTFLDLIDAQDRTATGEVLKTVRSGTGPTQSERRYRTLNASAVWMRESVATIDAGDGTKHLLIQVEDISDERRTRFELHRRALYDELTGLPNRAHLINQLRLAVDNASEIGDQIAVMFVDLNKFKAVNDTYGHEAGDQMLIEVADRLRKVCRTGDTVARLGGDEFVVVCTGVLDQPMARKAAHRYYEAINQPTVIGDIEMEISASIGFVVAGGDVEPDSLLRNADKAMYQAKTTEDAGIVEFDYTMRAATVDRLSQEVALRQAVQDGELELHYQPIVEGSTSDIVGVEALVRWHHPKQGLVSPGEFLPLANELGLMPAIDRWALETGAKALSEWSRQSDAAATWFLSVNTVNEHYTDPGFADWVADALVEAHLEPRRLVLERAESLVYDDSATTISTIRQLRSRGVRISLDQFGVGRTALADLAALEVDSLKIGRPFIKNATSRERHVLEGLVSIADGLGVELIVEGVESQADLDLVLKAGLRIVQGFHFSRPIDGDTLAKSRNLTASDAATSKAS